MHNVYHQEIINIAPSATHHITFVSVDPCSIHSRGFHGHQNYINNITTRGLNRSWLLLLLAIIYHIHFRMCRALHNNRTISNDIVILKKWPSRFHQSKSLDLNFDFFFSQRYSTMVELWLQVKDTDTVILTSSAVIKMKIRRG